MRYIVLFAAVMSLLTTHARVRGADLPPKLRDVLAEPPVLRESPKLVKSSTLCGCGITGKCECWKDDCSCSACKTKPAAKQALNIDPDHYCNRCGAYSNIVAKQAGGMHSHVCTNPSCRAEWWHADPGVKAAAPAPTYSLHSSSNCPNGNCPTSRTAPTRWRLFK